MIDINPKYITNSDGEQFVLLKRHEFDALLEALDDQDDIRIYDKAKKEDDGTRFLFLDYLKNKESKKA
ncbi:hypothetical protein [Dyadobacter frigoris]|uniref:Uncharacterized protein n=1 Tax=Dyadobacter frigoris TaxID=2576211 RepID=A0A4U6D330_9BACT|nr:hypothetical protein [Dyadobacter frigoris]TKT91046.1 hypothetical protein FDK13_15410 [Dyadobacter frigoris]GLU54968.1 hypothetical protein Dfri01_44290 [Dyadobacter frigoris]